MSRIDLRAAEHASAGRLGKQERTEWAELHCSAERAESLHDFSKRDPFVQSYRKLQWKLAG